MCVLRVKTLVLTAPSGIAQWKFENFVSLLLGTPPLAFICPCYALVELSSFLFVLILLGYILVDVFVPTILARDLAIVLQLFFFLLSACLVLPLPFVPAHFPCMVLWSFIFLHVGFLLHQALVSHYCTMGQFFLKVTRPFLWHGFCSLHYF